MVMTPVALSFVFWNPSVVIGETAVGLLVTFFGGAWLARWLDKKSALRELEKRMGTVESELRNLKTDLGAEMKSVTTTVSVSLASLKEVGDAHQKNAQDRHDFLVKLTETKFLALEGNLGGKLNAVERTVSSLPTAVETFKQYQSLSRALSEMHEDVRKHFVDCNEHIIGPMKEKLEKLRIPA